MTHTAKQPPVGIPFDEGFSSRIVHASDPDLSFWETIVGAPGIDGGDPVPTTTMVNTTVHTLAPRHLKRHTPFQVQGKFNGGTIDQIYALINVNGWITIIWPDATRYSFPGYYKSFTPGQAQEGNPLEGTLEVVPTMQIGGVETEYDLGVGSTGT